ncbi:LysM peptidoglycan-binding domain-containing protein [Aureivirga sp. CE67]|uniref:LysM peptidoglycan-binding domain-containing protein n=1 Tax=Aureivirga sp. CE67 TaxID=1788983 RepID=UPI0018CB6255|nr:LysM peptidoglycan-binding domain-containing protein [Aureivirga sp. CE67]
MKKLQLLLLVFFCTLISVNAQTGKKYLSYRVKKGETIESIAKDNDLKEKDLLRLNPDVDENPRVNSIIIIPNKSYDENNTKEEVVLEPSSTSNKKDQLEILQEKLESRKENSDGDFTKVSNIRTRPITKKVMKHIDSIHTVKLGDNLYALSKKYNVSLDSIIIANGLKSDELDFNQKLKIPMMVERTVTVQPRGGMKNVKKEYHTVVKGDTFYSLTKKYNTTKEKLIELNPELIEGLKLEQEIIVSEEVETTSYMQQKVFMDSIDTSREVNAYLMLPFKISKLSDTLTQRYFKAPSSKPSLLSASTDFYLGAMEAVDSLRSQGAKINIHVFDTEKSIDQLKKINEENDLSRADIFVGPLHLKYASYVANTNRTVPVVVPWYSKKDNHIFHARNLIKAAPNQTELQVSILDYMFNSYYPSQNIILLGDGKMENNKLLDLIESQLKSKDSTASVVKVIPKEESYIKNKELLDSLDPKKENLIIVTTKDKVIISVLNHLKLLNIGRLYDVEEEFIPMNIDSDDDADFYDIQLMSLVKQKNFNFIDVNLLGKLNFTFPTQNYINMEDENVKAFYESYRQKYHRTPSRFSVQGFDTTYDSLVRLLSNGSIYGAVEDGVSRRVGTMFDYKKNPSISFENQGTFILQYDKDLNVHVLN